MHVQYIPFRVQQSRCVSETIAWAQCDLEKKAKTARLDFIAATCSFVRILAATLL